MHPWAGSSRMRRKLTFRELLSAELPGFQTQTLTGVEGGFKNPHLDEKLMPRKITAKERTQLIAFIKSLTPEQKPFERPQLP
jgi:hypothetical protein